MNETDSLATEKLLSGYARSASCGFSLYPINDPSVFNRKYRGLQFLMYSPANPPKSTQKNTKTCNIHRHSSVTQSTNENTLINTSVFQRCRFSPLFCTHPSFTTFWSFMLAPRSEFKGQSSAWLPAGGSVLFPLSPLRPSRSALLFSHTLPLTLWCNVSASSFTFTLSLSLDPSDTSVVTQPGRKQQRREKHTHGSFSSASPPLSHTHFHEK